MRYGCWAYLLWASKNSNLQNTSQIWAISGCHHLMIPDIGQVLSESCSMNHLFAKVTFDSCLGRYWTNREKKHIKNLPPLYFVLTLESQVVDYDGSGQLEYKVFPLGSGWNHLHGGRMIPGWVGLTELGLWAESQVGVVGWVPENTE